MKSSKQSRRDAKQLFQSCLVNGVLDEGRVRQASSALVSRKPRGYLATLARLHRLVKLYLAERTANVESAVALDPALRSSVEANLTRVYGSGLRVRFSENATLLGGLRIQVGSDVYDGSVRARLARLEEGF
jgi:F-type H+-transporting ATPase subunit delta